MPVFKKINKDFFKVWNPSMAYVVGFFAADGYITLNNRGAYFWSIQITDGQLLEKIKKVIGSEHKISVRPGFENESALFRLQIGSKEMCTDLRELGFAQRKTKNLTVPNVSPKYFADFVRGYFDGDGNVWSGYMHKERKKQSKSILTAFTSCSENFLLTLHQRLGDYGITGGGVYCKNNAFCLKYGMKDSLVLYGLMYRKITDNLYLERKKRVFEDFLNICSRSSIG
ncbi:MAG: Uncharacterized protein G01um101448_438 [Parcubacteria group bacterium Gr01-1014_48]|nr:MAG: Uncharacterized protein Greene041614_418 [Parcubacteria group bacterium Greene0416_14]TSC73945.1 MAG: Uncharacterized protein G01um101448_438 [Parcubacteria group bacterium Gr01-1014_48]TSD00938.1 MAG: Uncharacterized protein Greene101415_588 [Parcubacteria group bacterium Greene1014_15]TSD07890.1 MAG: Uncharacterized protein Greene07144_616 [Parcubacteria group bacterium Greene0714_4]